MSTNLLKTSECATLTPREEQPVGLADSRDFSFSSRQQTFLGLANALRDRRRNGVLSDLPATELLLTQGGDDRIVCGLDGFNRYGCAAVPEPGVLAFGSSTASTISTTAFTAAENLRRRLQYAARAEAAPVTYERELERVRRELANLCDLEDRAGLEIIFGASGTDLHLLASQLVGNIGLRPHLIVRVEATETGRGVPEALAGHHFSDCAPFEKVVLANGEVEGGRPCDILEVKCRTEDGELRPAAEVDAEVESAVADAVASGRRVLLTLVDVSKTGFLAPSPACVKELRCRFPESIEVLVDACQFRLANATLKSYLEHDFLVAVTGSKFITGPTFCGALFVPGDAARRLRDRPLPRGLKSYSAQADWPETWAARESLNPVANYGLLLRWEAALSELRAFHQLPELAVTRFLETFARAVTSHLKQNPAFELLPAPVLDRGPITSGDCWDRLPTIFSFLLLRLSPVGQKAFLTQNETKRAHELVREDLSGLPGAETRPLLSVRCQVGQPVACGSREGVPVSALRLCASTRLIVDAVSPAGRGVKTVIAEALAVLDKIALVAALPLI